MIDYISNVENWNKKVVYAPNAFGKTTSSNYLKDYYNDNGEKVEIFTRKKIESLVASFEDNFYIGKYAKLEQKISEIKNQLDNEKIIEKIMKHTKQKSAATLKKCSFYCDYANISNTKSIPNIDKDILRKKKFLLNYSSDELKELDYILKLDLYSEINNFLSQNIDKKLKTKKLKAELDNNEVVEYIFKDIHELYLYCKNNKVTKCYLCGKSFKSHDQLLTHIESRFSELKITEDKVIILNGLINRVMEMIGDSRILNDLLSSQKNNTFNQQLSTISLFKTICEADISYFHNLVLDYKIKVNENEEVEVKELVKTNNKISNILNESLSKDRITRFNNYVKGKIDKLLNFNSDIKITFYEDKCGMQFYLKGKKIKPYELLSESEVKRLSLIVLDAEIRYQHIKTVILDDPIDSYDDYNKRLACNYIKDILSRKSINNWYIFTNDFECVYYLAIGLQCKINFCLDDINEIFNNSKQDIIVECKWKEMKDYIAKNDLYYLDYFVNARASRFLYDADILFCALTLTLRNVKTDFLNKFNNIEIIDNNNALNKQNWSQYVKEYIEGYAEHYDINYSSTIEVKDIAKPFLEMYVKQKSVPSRLIQNSDKFEQYREMTAKANLSYINNYTYIINYLFKKVVIINYLKYELEKKLMLLVKNNFTALELSEVESQKSGLFSRIQKADEINKQKAVKIDGINKINRIHIKYSSLYNPIDHGTTLLISPYLSTSIKDIINFKNEISKI